MGPEISVVIPVYNSEAIIEKSVWRMTSVLDSLRIDYEILMKDDGSIDKSCDVLRKLSRENHRVQWSAHQTNRGLGATLCDLFREAKGEYLIYCDCDLPFGEEIIPILIEGIKNCDILVASRYCGNRNAVTLTRKIASRSYYLLCKALFGINITDIGSGTVAIRRQSLDRLNLKASGFGIHAELIVKAARHGLLAKEIAAESYANMTGSFNIGKHGLQVFRETIALWSKKL